MIAKKIQKYITMKGLKQSRIAAAIGMTDQMMSECMTGRRILKADELCAILSFLEITLEELIRATEDADDDV